MQDREQHIKIMKLLCHGFFIGLTLLIIIFSVTTYDPVAEQAEDGIVFLVITLLAMMGGLMVNVIGSKIINKQLEEDTRNEGSLALAKYQILLIMRVGAAEAPALLGLIFFFFLAKPPIEDPLSLLYFAPCAVFYLILFSHYPTAAKLESIEQRILNQNTEDENPYQQNS